MSLNCGMGELDHEGMNNEGIEEAGTRLTRKNIRGCGSFLENLSSIPSLINFCKK